MSNNNNLNNDQKSKSPKENQHEAMAMLSSTKAREEFLAELIDLLRKKLPAAQANIIAEFVGQYYATVALDDLASHELSDLYAALLSHWHLMYQRKKGEAKIRVYNPQYEQNGWQSEHTVIEVSYDDMPFLVDSIQMELNRRGLTTYMLIHVGGLKVCRDEKNQMTGTLPPGTSEKNYVQEAAIFFEIDRETNPKKLKELENSIAKILGDVHAVVEDWQKMVDKLDESLENLINNPPPVDKIELDETIAFLKWIKANHFTFMGCRDYSFTPKGESGVLNVVPGSGLGLLRESINEPTRSRDLSGMPENASKIALSKSNILIIAKTNTKSSIHRPAYPDVIVVKFFDKAGNLIGGRHFIGLYTSAAYNRTPRDIPFLRQKIAEVLKMSALLPTGHAGKALINILETFPRDDLFQADIDELFDIVMGILHLQERRRIRLFIRKDIYGRFMSCLVYVPRDRYDTGLRQDIQDLLTAAFNGEEVSFTTTFSESILARIHYMIRINPTLALQYNTQELEEKIIEVARSWEDDLLEYIKESFGEEHGNEIITRFLNLRGFPVSYREENPARTAVYDIHHIEALTDEYSLEMSLFQPIDALDNVVRFKLYSLNNPMPLSDVLPILENMGLRVIGEDSYKINLVNNSCAWIGNFEMTYEQNSCINIDSIKESFQEAFSKIWFQEAENDGFNRLVLLSNLTWREIVVLRAYAKYFRQMGFNFSQNYIEKTLTKYSRATNLLIQLFKVRFDPMQKPDQAKLMEKLEHEIHTEFAQVASLDEDRILRQYFEVIKATLRTNYYQKNKEDNFKNYLSLKLDSEKVPELPLPKPMFEIYVYSPFVEGIHLRNAKVARGGLRYTDRPEDYRTEVLGLMKAQKVKNSVIVPSGAKGGFLPKLLTPGADRETTTKEVVACYKTFIRGLLDLTDNLKGTEIIHPTDVLFYDEDDPYLVVAADKGTATFSNYANEVAEEYDFWLGDAFASGGGTGYDHKQMGITARGAWESVKRHFRELDFNMADNDFTVVGIGDMAGDVFGNGMLLSEHIKLLGAFNHAHIFVDPDPDSAKSFIERKRLFALPRSSWEDYNPQVLSKGGAVYSRSAKQIKLSPEIMQRFGFTTDLIKPNELIIALLKAKVDLLWNGGIGTFFKATDEHNSNVGDKTNDAIRINGCELNCKVVGEGGNLGFTQLARVEYALKGGMIYTDFIDNSAGVDCSDHEVNTKILLNTIVANGDMTMKQRNQLLATMTNDVGRLVLRDNYMQTQAISIAAAQANNNMDFYIRLIQELDASGKLNRTIEFLPTEKELLERKSSGKGLTKPEIAVLLSYSKMILKANILESDLPEDPYLSTIITTAFPDKLSEMFPEQLANHSLRREIIATQLSNTVINDMGITFVHRVQEETGATIASIVRCYMVAQDVFKMRQMWSAIEDLDYVISCQVQIDMMLSVGRLIRRATRWFLRNHRGLTDAQLLVELYSPGVELLYKNLSKLLLGNAKDYLDLLFNNYVEAGVPEGLAHQVSSTSAMFSVLDIVAVTNQYGFAAKDVAKMYFALGAHLNLAWFRWQMIQQPTETHWDVLLKANFRDDIDWQQRELTIGALQYSADLKNIENCIKEWCTAHETLIARWENILSEIRSSLSKDFVMFAVAVRGLLELTQASRETVKQQNR